MKLTKWQCSESKAARLNRMGKEEMEEMPESEMIKAIYEDMQEMKKQIKDLQITLENETNRNIKVISGME